MQVSIETTSGLERRLTVEVPAAEVEDAVSERIEKAAKTVRLNGFRPGRVPVRVVRQRFGSAIRQEVIGETLSRTFQDAVSREGVRPAGPPRIDPMRDEPGEDLALGHAGAGGDVELDKAAIGLGHDFDRAQRAGGANGLDGALHDARRCAGKLDADRARALLPGGGGIVIGKIAAHVLIAAKACPGEEKEDQKLFEQRHVWAIFRRRCAGPA